VLKGGKPNLTQIGPYTYLERRQKFDITWHQNNTVSYRQNKTFTFLPHLSRGGEDDVITTVNPLLPVLVQGTKDWSFWRKMAIATGLSGFDNEGMFITRSVKELLWGYEDPALQYLKESDPETYSVSTVGYFINQNTTDDGVYTIDTGANNVSDIGKIRFHKGRSKHDIWSTNETNMIKGTDGSLGPPLNFKGKTVTAYLGEICRTLTAVYTGDTDMNGIRVRRFENDRYDLESASVNPKNYGYCTPKGTPVEDCPPAGIVNASLCHGSVGGFTVPGIFSLPHFLFADPSIQNQFDGLNPNEEEHKTVVDIEPWTGTPLRALKRAQVNIFVEKSDYLHQTGNISTMIFPIFWGNESAVASDMQLEMLKDSLFNMKDMAEVGRVVLVISGGMLAFVCILALIFCKVRSPKHKF